jgi:uncharacterized lipoprotein YajG
MNTFRRLTVLAALLSAAACSSSPTTTADEAHTARQPSFANQTVQASNSTTDADSSTSRRGGNLMGGN